MSGVLRQSEEAGLAAGCCRIVAARENPVGLHCDARPHPAKL